MNKVLVGMTYSDKFLPFIRDLGCKTLVNQTGIPFITSDNPVIRHNQWMESKNHYVGATGFGVKGLQIFMPIHPGIMICLYDKSTYKYGEKNKLVITTKSVSDVLQLNALEYLFSESHLFFNEILTEQYFKDLMRTYNNNKREVASFVTTQNDQVTYSNGQTNLIF